MSATKLTPVRVSQTGVSVPTPVNADLTNGNSVPNLDTVRLVIANASEATSPVTVTFVTTATVEGYAVADYTATVPVGESKAFGKFSHVLFGDAVEFKCSAAVSISVSV